MSSPVYLKEGGTAVEVEVEVTDVDAGESVVQILLPGDQEADQEVADAWMDEHEVQA